MKKIIILSFATLVLLTLTVSPIQAAQESSAIPAWFSNAIQPIKDILATLISKTENFEARIAELEKRVDFEVPTQWSAEFYETPPETKIVMNPTGNCTWYGGIIGSYVTARAIAHLSTGDMFGVGTCGEITFKSNVILTSGTTFEADIYLWWQGTEKYTKQTVTIPERPFRSLLIINNGGSLINGVITSSGTIGIGTTSATQNLIIDCGVYNCSDLWKINN